MNINTKQIGIIIFVLPTSLIILFFPAKAYGYSASGLTQESTLTGTNGLGVGPRYGDINGDNITDLILSEQAYSTQKGRIHIYYVLWRWDRFL